MTSVLYDHPGPKAKARNLLYTVVFSAVLVAALVWAGLKLKDKGEADWAKWEPFTRWNVWTNFLLPGLAKTLEVALLSVAIALVFGMLLAIGRLSDHRWVRLPVGAFVEFFRAIPVVMLMLFAAGVYVQLHVDSSIRPMVAAVTALVLYNASVLCEVFRAGIAALPRGQTEAGFALGLRKSQLMQLILIPQAFTAMLPAIISQLVVTLKDTALGSVFINLDELFRKTTNITGNFANPVATYTVIALIYIALNLTLSRTAILADRAIQRRRYGGKEEGPTALAPTGAPAVPLPGTDLDTGRAV